MTGEAALARSPRERVSSVASAIKPSGIRRFFDLMGQYPDVISLGIGEPDLATPIEVRMAAVSALIQGNTRYTPNAGTLQLREAIADYLQQRLSVTYQPHTEVLVTAGVAQGVDLALRALVNPGDDVLIPEPCFVSYAPCAALAGGNAIPVPLRPEDGYVLTPEILEACMTPKARVLLINFPNNPTGAVMTERDVARLIPIMDKYDLTVISDEIYSELVYGDPHASFASIPNMRDRTVVLNGFSKTFSMTGWRLGYAAGPEPIIECMTKVHQHALMCASTTAQIGALKALTLVDQVTAQARETYGLRRRLLWQGLQSLGLPCIEPRGAFFAFPSIESTGMTAEEFAERLLVEEQVAVVPGTAFGHGGQGHVRCSYAVETDKLELALERMARFLARHCQR